jgi:hypothetical protein
VRNLVGDENHHSFSLAGFATFSLVIISSQQPDRRKMDVPKPSKHRSGSLMKKWQTQFNYAENRLSWFDLHHTQPCSSTN